jgi:hypothetical protein
LLLEVKQPPSSILKGARSTSVQTIRRDVNGIAIMLGSKRHTVSFKAELHLVHQGNGI